MEQTAIIKIHNLAAGLTVSVLAANRMAPMSAKADRERKSIEHYLEPHVAPLIAARVPFAHIVEQVRGWLAEAGLTEQEAATTQIVKGEAVTFYE